MRVYRVETEDGTGPYSTDRDWMHDVAANECTGLHNPGPERDGIKWPLYGASAYVCGFATLGHALRWWPCPDARAVLHDHGYLLAEYEVGDDAVIAGEMQVVFRRGEAELIERRPLTMLEEGPEDVAA